MKEKLKKWTENGWKKADQEIELTVLGLSQQLKIEREVLAHCNDEISKLQSSESWVSDEDTVAMFDVLTQEVERRSKRITELMKQLDSARELKKKAKARKVSPDTAFAGAVSLASVLLIIHAEQVGIVASKAMSFVTKPRL